MAGFRRNRWPVSLGICNPYTYFVDVLQRVAIHPAKRVAELTPRLWKIHFADNPLRSDIDRDSNNVSE